MKKSTVSSMKDITKIQLTFNQIFGGDFAVPVEITEAKKYENGKYTDEVECYKVTALCVCDKSYDKVVVKVLEKPPVTNEEIQKAQTPMQIRFQDFTSNLYRDYKNNTYQLTCKARALQIVANK